MKILRLGLWFGLLMGFAEVLILAVRRLAFGQLIHVSWHFFWMAPLADAVFFVVGAAGIALIAALLRGRLPARVPVALFLAVTTICLVLHLPKLHPAALLVIAAGAAIRLSAMPFWTGERLDRLVGRSVGWLALGVVLLALGGIGWLRIRERRALAGLPAAESGAPNVLLIVLDTVRAFNLSLYGYARPTTPELEKFAARGVRFDAAFSTAPWTLPSHASMLTGRYPHELSADWLSSLDRRYPTLAERFAARGYATGGFVANVGYLSYEFGLDRGFQHYEDYLIRPREIIQSSALGRQLDQSPSVRRLAATDQHLVRVDAPSINSRFLAWLDGAGPRPFFAFLNFYDAHGPYLPPAPFDRRFGTPRANDLSPLHRFLNHPNQAGLPADVVRAEMDQYDDALAYLDQELGRLFAELDRRGVLDHTIVLLTADHGEEFGEHGIFDHGNSLYAPSVRVPLLIVAPNRAPAARVVTAPVTLRDLAATLTDLAHLPPSDGFPGRSLARFWLGNPPPVTDSVSPVLSEVSKGIRTPAWYPVSRGNMRSLADSQVRYILGGDGTEQLFSLGDVWESRPLADSVPVLAPFRETLRRLPWRQ